MADLVPDSLAELANGQVLGFADWPDAEVPNRRAGVWSSGQIDIWRRGFGVRVDHRPGVGQQPLRRESFGEEANALYEAIDRMVQQASDEERGK